MAEQPPNSKFEYDPGIRHQYDAVTLFAESLDGRMRTPSEYAYDGHELYASDGGKLSEMFHKGIKDAEKLAAHKPNLAFELRRRYLEQGEYRDMLKLCRGELVDVSGTPANTLVVTSDFPPELMHITQDVGGYKASRKETMLRAITFTNDKIQMFTQTLDGSNRQALEAIHRSLGYEPQPGELLGQRMCAHIAEEDQQYLVDRLMGVYDRSLAEQFSGSWYAGRQHGTQDVGRNTYEFASNQTDLVVRYVQHKLEDSYTPQLQYQLLALLHKRFSTNTMPLVPQHSIGGVAMHHQQYVLLTRELEQAGHEAQAKGKVFSACGSTVGANGELSANEQLSVDGYGNRTTAETKYSFDKKMYCVVCQAPPKKSEQKKMCGPCGICKGCDTKLSKKKP